MTPQYRIFYSWQSDIPTAKVLLLQSLNEVVRQLKGKGIHVIIEQGGGGSGFISIEDSVRTKIRRSDIFVGDVTPVGRVDDKGKLLPNANVMYEMGVATEVMTADRIIAVAMKGDWRVEDMPFDFNHYSMLLFDPEKDFQKLLGRIKQSILETDRLSRIANGRFFSDRLMKRNMASEKYLPDTFLESMEKKELARMFLAPNKFYALVYKRLFAMNFDHYNKIQRLNGSEKEFRLDLRRWDLEGKAIDMFKLSNSIEQLHKYISDEAVKLRKNGYEGGMAAFKVEELRDKLAAMRKQIMVVISAAGQGKTNFLCDLISNVLITSGVPFIFVNAYELSAEQLARSIAAEYDFIGNGSLEEVLLKADRFCQRHLQFFVIVIDGLNEHPKQSLFKGGLMRLLESVVGYNHVKVLMTCRKDFWDENFQMIEKTLGDKLIKVSLDRHHKSWNDEETTEDICLLERYGSFYETGVPTHPSIRRMLLDDRLLMRIFFEGYKGQDVTSLIQIDYIDLYDRYLVQLNEKIQVIIEQEAIANNTRGMAQKLFHRIIEWAVAHRVFTNIPLDGVLSTLTADERSCFSAFMSANLLLKHDLSEGALGTNDVLNFTYEQIRDYLVTRYLVDEVYNNDKDRFVDLIRAFTAEDSNLAEGTKMFLFLYARTHENKEICDLLKAQPWYEVTSMQYIWDLPEDIITDEEISQVKDHIKKNPESSGRMVSYIHWSPERYRKLNVLLFFEAIEEMDDSERADYLEKLSPSTVGKRLFFGVPVVTPRGHLLSQIRLGITRRKDKDDEERKALERLDECFSKNMGLVYVPMHNEEKNNNSVLPVFAYDSYRYLMKVHKGEKEDFLAQAGAREGYSREMFSMLYDAVFSEASDVKELYNEYYSNEYRDIRHFLSMHYSIPDKYLSEYVDVCESEDYRLIDFNSLSYGGDAVNGLVMSDDMGVRMYNWLNWQKDKDENKN